jgi:hypothetical protein
MSPCDAVLAPASEALGAPLTAADASLRGAPHARFEPMTHLSEERNIAASPHAIWAVVADTKRWPQFFATPREIGRLWSVEYLDGATEDALGVKRRLHFLGVPSWDEQVTRWRVDDSVTWLGVRNPGQKYWTQQMELVPGRGFTTLRWDVFFELQAPRAVRKAYKRTLEDIMLAGLGRIERMANQEK